MNRHCAITLSVVIASLVASSRRAEAGPSAPFTGGSDNCSTPDVIVGFGLFPLMTSSASTGVDGQSETLCTPSPVLDDVWFTWTAPSTGVVTVSTCGLVTMDSKIQVFLGNTCPTPGTALTCNDDACGVQSSVSLGVTAGTSYMIQIGHSLGTAGDGGVTITSCPAPANDACSAASNLSGETSTPTDTTCATLESGGYCAQTDAPDIWYKWVSGVNLGTKTNWRFSLCMPAQPYKPKLSIYDACSGTLLDCSVACPPPDTGEQICFEAPPMSGATNYWVRVSGEHLSGQVPSVGTGTLVIARSRCNDTCLMKEQVFYLVLVEFDTTEGTTGIEGQNFGGCNFGGQTGIANDLWWVFISPVTDTLQVTTCGLTATDTKIAVYAGSTCPVAPPLGCNDDSCGLASRVCFSAVAGQAYTIQLGLSPGALPGPGRFLITSCTTFTPYCFGDGSGTACPCGNSGLAGRGCASSVSPSGALLDATGVSSISADSMVLTGSDMPNSSCLYFQGTAQIAGGNGTVFGDGLRCAGGSVLRLGTKINAGGTSSYPTGGDVSISIRGANSAGNTRHYQAWYRNAAAFCTPSTFNLTNGISTTWAP